jgi:hypothetical protein
MSCGAVRPRARLPIGVLVVVAASALYPFPACATEDVGRFTLPLKLALAIGSSALEARRAAAQQPAAAVPGAPQRRKAPSIVPRQLHIPDGYSLEYDRDPPRFAEPVNRNNLVKVDIPGPRPHGWKTLLSWDEQSRGPLGHSDNLLRVVVEYRW